MEQIFFSLPVSKKLFLQIGKNYSVIPIAGYHSYACAGKEAILYYVNELDEVSAVRFFGGHPNRIEIFGFRSTGSIFVFVEAFSRSVGANPKLVSDDFSYEFVDVL